MSDNTAKRLAIWFKAFVEYTPPIILVPALMMVLPLMFVWVMVCPVKWNPLMKEYEYDGY
jgi:hypothetical protein